MFYIFGKVIDRTLATKRVVLLVLFFHFYAIKNLLQVLNSLEIVLIVNALSRLVRQWWLCHIYP